MNEMHDITFTTTHNLPASSLNNPLGFYQMGITQHVRQTLEDTSALGQQSRFSSGTHMKPQTEKLHWL